nr:GDSL-type esterase/lipase family protein [Massilia niastensis]
MSSLAQRVSLPATPSSPASAAQAGAVNRGRRRLLLGAPALAGALAMPAAPARAQAGYREPWCATWGCAPAGPTPTASTLSFSNQTLRLVARASIGASRVRVRLSNEMGGTELRIGAARIGLRGPGATVVAGTNFPLSFGGRSWVSIPAGAPVLSDPVALPVPAFAELAVSLYLPGTVQGSTMHSAACQTSYASTAGDHSALAALPVQRSFSSWPFLTEIDADSPATALVVAGDSITDGIGSTVNTNRRWPDWLAQRLRHEPGGSTRYAVVNRGISANRMLLDTPTALLAGHDLLERFDRDVLATPGLRVFGVLIGINDINQRHHPQSILGHDPARRHGRGLPPADRAGACARHRGLGRHPAAVHRLPVCLAGARSRAPGRECLDAQQRRLRCAGRLRPGAARSGGAGAAARASRQRRPPAS